jgi:hypothetical protein
MSALLGQIVTTPLWFWEETDQASIVRWYILRCWALKQYLFG